MMSIKDKTSIIEVNKKQAEFYNQGHAQKNLPTRVWSYFRNKALSGFRDKLDIKDQVYSQHKEWLGDLSNKKVLDLGCLYGNHLSIYMAKRARKYIGIDLSAKGINHLKQRLATESCPDAEAITIDFLADDFHETDFDIIYAYGVLHHFKNLDILINRLKQKLKPGGLIISYDPLKTSFPIRVIRTLYRPFQSDKEWEWPFDKSTLLALGKHFKIIERHGVLAKSKYGIIVNLLPIPNSQKLKIIKNWHQQDWELSAHEDNRLFQSMHITMLLQNLS